MVYCRLLRFRKAPEIICNVILNTLATNVFVIKDPSGNLLWKSTCWFLAMMKILIISGSSIE